MNAQTIKFGMELECYVPSEYREYFQVGAYHNGIQLRLAPEGWNGQSDSSITLFAPYGYFGCEVVSPVLAGEDGLIQAYYMVDTLREFRAKVDDRCGLHVHVDARQLNQEQIDNITRRFIQYEKAFYGLSGAKAKARWENHYCANSHEWSTSPYGPRYRSLNIQNWLSPQRRGKRTLEFRVWKATTNVAEVITALHMAVALVVGAANDVQDDLQQIAGCLEAAQAFNMQYLQNVNLRIVPEEDTNQLQEVLLQKCRQADHAFSR